MIVNVTEGLHLTYVTLEDDWVKTDLGVFTDKRVAYALAEWAQAQPDLGVLLMYMRVVNRRQHPAQVMQTSSMIVTLKRLSAAE